MKRVSNNRLALQQLLPWLALLCSTLLFGLHFFVGGGRTKLINAQSSSMTVVRTWPWLRASDRVRPTTRVSWGHFVASVIAFVSGVSSLAAFQIVTIASFIAALLLLRKIMSRQGARLEWQAAVLLALGCALAATFGYTPVMVDPLLLVLTCLRF